MTIIYVYNGQDDRLAQVRNHKVDGVDIIIVNNTGSDDYIAAVNRGIVQSSGWLVIANLDRVIDRDRVPFLQLGLQRGSLYVLDNGNAFLIHKDDIPAGRYTEPFIEACNGLDIVTTNIIFDLWDEIPYDKRIEKEETNQFLEATIAVDGITVI